MPGDIGRSGAVRVKRRDWRRYETFDAMVRRSRRRRWIWRGVVFALICAGLFVFVLLTDHQASNGNRVSNLSLLIETTGGKATDGP